jgi:hypothetical protein
MLGAHVTVARRDTRSRFKIETRDLLSCYACGAHAPCIRWAQLKEGSPRTAAASALRPRHQLPPRDQQLPRHRQQRHRRAQEHYDEALPCLLSRWAPGMSDGVKRAKEQRRRVHRSHPARYQGVERKDAAETAPKIGEHPPRGQPGEKHRQGPSARVMRLRHYSNDGKRDVPCPE